jgi:predicted phage terminase large subunit-like protein
MNRHLAMTPEERDAVYRNDLSAFIQKAFGTLLPGATYHHNWHVDAIAWHLQQCFEGKIRRLIITLPPRNLKSLCASVAFPAWVLGRNPSRRIICASYGMELTGKLARDCRALMDAPFYKRLFPATRLNPRKDAELDFETTQKGYRFSTTIGGAMTGRGGNIVIIDDPIKPTDATSDLRRKAVKDWYDGTLQTRLDDKRNDVIILVMQRVHDDDLVSHVLERGDWVHLDLPAIADEHVKVRIGPNLWHERRVGDLLHPEREPKAVLDELRRSMGTYLFSAQYLQRPIPEDGNLVRWDWFKTYEHPPAYNSDGYVVQSWDTASKAGELNDYSVCTTWLVKGRDYYLLDLVRQRLEYPFLKRRALELKQKWDPKWILIEDKGSGTQLLQDFRIEYRFKRAWPITPDSDKITRFSSQSAQIEDGRVHLPANAPWLPAFKAEVLAFPNGKFDDQVDSLSQFLGYMDWRRANTGRSGTVIGWY